MNCSVLTPMAESFTCDLTLPAIACPATSSKLGVPLRPANVARCLRHNLQGLIKINCPTVVVNRDAEQSQHPKRMESHSKGMCGFSRFHRAAKGTCPHLHLSRCGN